MVCKCICWKTQHNFHLHTLRDEDRYKRIGSVNCLDLISECFLVMSSHLIFLRNLYVDWVLDSFLRFPTSSQLLTQMNRFSMMNLFYIRPHTEKTTLLVYIYETSFFFSLFRSRRFEWNVIVLDLSVLPWNISWIPRSRSKKFGSESGPLQIKDV